MKKIRNVLSASVVVTALISTFTCAAIQEIDNQRQQEPQLFVGSDTYTYVGDEELAVNITLFDDRFNDNGCIYSATSRSVDVGWTLIEINKRTCTGDYQSLVWAAETVVGKHYKVRSRTIKHKKNGKTVNELTRGDLVEKL